MPETEGVVWEEYHDRSAGLMIFGLLQVGLGLLAILFVALIGFSVSMMSALGAGANPQGMPNVQQMLPMYVLGALMLVAAAGVFMTLGVGSILARRWARTLSLALWSMLLAYGVVMSVNWIFMSSMFGRMMEASMKAGMQGGVTGTGQPIPPAPPGVASFMMVFMMIFTVVLGIGLPLPFVLFYRSKHVKATCEWRDAVPRWTDTRPIPVLVASLLMMMFAAVIIQQGATNSFFIGVSLVGAAGIVGAVIAAGVFLAAAAGFLRMRQWGWWIAAVATILEAAVWLYAAVMGKTDIFNMSAYMAGNVAAVAAGPEFLAHSLWTMAFCYVILAAYVVWVKRYFRRASGGVSAA